MAYSVDYEVALEARIGWGKLANPNISACSFDG
jgi:hypothetical protein